jgi:hypothetical protein
MVTVSTSVLLIGLLNCLFKGSKQVNTWMELCQPLMAWWIAYFVVAAMGSEAVRRRLQRRENGS